MSESFSSAAKKAGLPPGSLVHVGERHESQSHIRAIHYSKTTIEEYNQPSTEQLLQLRTDETVTWIIVEGLNDINFIESLGQHFNVHPLVLEDILNTHQRPKFEEYDDYLYFVIKGLELTDDTFSIDYEQISILLFNNLVFVFKEKQDGIFEPIIKRLSNDKGRFRRLGSDYLLYAILDTVVDLYFHLHDSLDETLEDIEEQLLQQPNQKCLVNIQMIKRELVYFRKSVTPLRDMLSGLLRYQSPLIQQNTQVYFRDVFDHVLRVSEANDSYREITTGLLDIYISSVSNKMNEVMKVLTVFASIFIPLTFLAGIYGMNFDYMPELHWKWAYPTLWLVFITLPIVLIIYFKKKKWL